jgi:hypothetical protein
VNSGVLHTVSARSMSPPGAKNLLANFASCSRACSPRSGFTDLIIDI